MAKNSASTVHQPQTATQFRTRRPITARCTPSASLLRCLLQLRQPLFGDAVLRRFGERGTIALDRLVALPALAMLLADEDVDFRRSRIELAVHLENRDGGVGPSGFGEPPCQLVDFPLAEV